MKRCCIGLVASLLLLSGCPERPGPDTDEGEALARYLRGLTYIDEGRFGEAAVELNASVELDPSRPQAHHRLGDAYLGVRRLEDAEESFEKALELEPDKYLSYMGLGHALRLQKKFDDAIDAYRHAAELKPNRPEPHEFMGQTHSEQGDDSRAAEAFAEAVKRTSPEETAKPLEQRANSLAAAGSHEEAMDVFEEVLEILPRDPKALFRVVPSAIYPADIEDAVAGEQAARLEEVWLGLAESSVRAGDLERALQAYESAAEINPKDTITKQLLAAVHEALDDVEQALVVYHSALQEEPHSPRLWVGFARLHLLSGNREEAARAADRGLQHLGGDDVELIRKLGDIFAELQQSRRSAELYRLLLLETPEDGDLWIALARQLDALGEEMEVAQICRRLQGLAERNGVSAQHLNWCTERASEE